MNTIPWRQGTKLVYLPNLIFTLYKRSNLPPNFAAFKVPLHVNKFDVRDYLLHVYNLKVLSVRSMIFARKLYRNRMGQVKRPKSIKKVIVEMEEPFVFPEPPEDLSPWQMGQLLPDGTSVRRVSQFSNVYEPFHVHRVNAELGKTHLPEVIQGQSLVKAMLKKLK
ncbi:ribosomal protein subunit L23 [Schizosaccharomyces japonicus yFS275]|uniref:Large ribosomal subunit protein uL23m n=1 Tax=Schizosaccharomyces japonicus (strain yFS275 / FY16936) TaxID=402676 RepID=B6JWM1_SCHJY|nr:ribosomal protein subunit L23 [Schizosaccharomyces japonicus yFS275]EEB05772.1 ribosomal protein subunit L23 [Schizosaccharomyces japonicus yFS275]